MVIAIKKIFDLYFEKYADEDNLPQTFDEPDIQRGDRKSIESVAKITPSKKDKMDYLNLGSELHQETKRTQKVSQ